MRDRYAARRSASNMFCPSEVFVASVPIARFSPASSIARAGAGADPQVAHRIVDDARAGVRETRDVVLVDPYAVRGAEVRSGESQSDEVLDHALAVALQGKQRLRLRLGEMRLKSDGEFMCERRASGHERVAAMQWNRRRDGRTHPFAVERPMLERISRGRKARVGRRRRKLCRLCAHGVGQRFEQSRTRASPRRKTGIVHHAGREG